MPIAGRPDWPGEQPQRPTGAPLPDADPSGHYRPAAVGGHRTARWFILVGVALVIMVLPLAVPVKDDAGATGSPGGGSSYRLADAAFDSLLTWENWPLDLGALEGRCAPLDTALLPGTITAECSTEHGMVDLDIVGMLDVGDGAGDIELASQRGLRMIMPSDTSGVPFHERDAGEHLSPGLAVEVDDFRASPLTPFSWGASDPVYSAAASFLNSDAGGVSVLYTVSVTGGTELSAASAANSLMRGIRATV